MKKSREFPTPSGNGFISSHEEIETLQNAQNRNEGGAIPGPLVLNGESRYQPRIGALDVVYHSLDYFSAVAQFWRQRRQRGQTDRQRKCTL